MAAHGIALQAVRKSLQWGHGREAMDGSLSAATLNTCWVDFNGAMAVRPWMDGGASAALARRLTSMGPWP